MGYYSSGGIRVKLPNLRREAFSTKNDFEHGTTYTMQRMSLNSRQENIIVYINCDDSVGDVTWILRTLKKETRLKYLIFIEQNPQGLGTPSMGGIRIPTWFRQFLDSVKFGSD